MTQMKVMKFGGGCLRNADDFLRVADIIRSEAPRPAVVVSAIHGVTDMLQECVLEAKKGEQNVSCALDSIRARHFTVIERTMTSGDIKQEIAKNANAMLARVKRLLYGIAYTGEITSAIRSRVLSYGERLAAMILSGVLQSLGVESIFLESDRIGMITDDKLENATVNLTQFKKNFVPTVRLIQRTRIVPVITGFFGYTPNGAISTFGRNGSDYSAAVVAYGIRALELEIWKDADGFMSADPKLVRNARRIDRLSHYEAAELSYFGAKILHPRTLEPLAGLRIRVRIKNINHPKRAGTEIMPEGYQRKDVIKSVTYNNGIAILRIHGPGVGFKPGIIGEIGLALATVGINIYSIITSQTCINLLIDEKEAVRSYEVLKKVRGGVIERVDLEKDVSLIAIVGEGLQKRKGLGARMFYAVSAENVNIEMISSGASEVASYFVVRARDTQKTVKAIHREFFSKK
jgi:aspartate kinase